MSPFLNGEDNNNNAGLYGVRAMGFEFNLDSSAKRVISTSTPGMTISLEETISAHLNLNYLSCQASDIVKHNYTFLFSCLYLVYFMTNFNFQKYLNHQTFPLVQQVMPTLHEFQML